MSAASRWFGRSGTESALPDAMPAIRLLVDASCGEGMTELAGRIAAGCEEEGIPLSWDAGPGRAADLARAACMASRLEVGIGVDAGGNGAIAMVHVTDAPYVERPAETADQLRWLGQAAARISKSQPIVHDAPKESPPPPQRSNDTPQDSSDFANMIARITRTIMRETQEGGVDGHE